LQLFAILCAVAAPGCALIALWIYAVPTLGAAGSLLVVSAALCAVGFAAFVLRRPTRKSRSPSPTPDVGASALLAVASSPFKQHAGLALLAALLTGVFLGGEN
jgi:hypothetical protein